VILNSDKTAGKIRAKREQKVREGSKNWGKINSSTPLTKVSPYAHDEHTVISLILQNDC